MIVFLPSAEKTSSVPKSLRKSTPGIKTTAYRNAEHREESENHGVDRNNMSKRNSGI